MKKESVNKVKSVNLNEIKDPKFLMDLSHKELDKLADDIRNEIIRATSVYGGHLSSNLGVVDLTIALNRIFDFSTDKLILDVGHQCYAYKILTGRSLEGLRTKDGVSGFQKCEESPYDCFEAGHSSTSISAATGFAIARDLNGDKYDVVAMIGDGSIVSGLSMEALNNLGTSSHKVIIVLNDNGMSISKPIGGVSKMFARISTAGGYNRMKVRFRAFMSKTRFGRRIYNFLRGIKNFIRRLLVPQTIFNNMGLAYIGPVDGHNIRGLERAFKRAKNTNRSVVVHVSTMKGKGYSPAEEDESGYWHGVTPFEIESGDPKNTHEGYNSWSHIFSDITMEMMEKHNNAYLISPATLKGAGLDQVFTKYPERTLDVGIAEEHAFTLASGLCKGGYHPIISIYSTFMQRAYDEISHDLSRMDSQATILVDRAGLVGADGETHQGIYDVAFLKSIPNVTVTMPSSIDEAHALYSESFNNHGPFFIRLPRSIVKNEPINIIDVPYGKWMTIKDSSKKDTVVIGVGPLFRELEKLVNESGIDCTLINAIYLIPMDLECIDSLLNHKRIFIYDAYSTSKGLIESIMAYLSQKHFNGLIKAFGVPNKFIKQASINEQLEEFGLLPSQILDELKK